ncbi:hypothetical protein PMI02_04226 [Novosphingobium sp. AP12]|nr:hypothetical protein PMI02_04226 [Novosphingobium sp. AP12]
MSVRRHASQSVLAIALLAPAPAAAQEKPYIEVDMTVFSGRNPFLIPGDTAITTAGEIGLRGEATVAVDRKTSLALDGAGAYRGYDRKFGTFVTGHAMAKLAHRSSERFDLATEAAYERYLPLEGMTASIDAAIDPVSVQERYALDQDVRWHPDALTTLSGSVGWTRISPIDSPVLTRTDGTTFLLSAERRLSRTTWVGMETETTRSDSEGGGEALSYSVALKGGTRIARGLTAEFAAGISKISRTEGRGSRQGGSGQLTASASLCYDPRRFRFCLSGRVSPVITSFDGIRREKSLNATFDLKLMPRANFTIEADYRSMPGAGRLSDPQVMRGSARYEYQVDRRLKLNIGADYDRRTGLARQTLDTWTVRVGATFRIPSL